ncbi:MAG: tRNA guanosine(34) transglycosylase Tgt [Bacteroidales bacterium]|nr:tRNA guanosine(34) transglycosylase Tgt [Bacteroidales bacterium]
MKFTISAIDSKSNARAGSITTDHGEIETPIFMPVGTVGSVKGIYAQDLKDHIDAQIILGNTYHLYLRPGTEIIEQAGGIQKFNAWNKPMLTDSGGFQVFSLAHRRKITEEGVTFSSHIDGSKHLFTPENVMDIQRKIGADIIMAFDECPPYPCDKTYAKESMELTHRWLERCITHFNNTQPLYGHNQTLFPIVQGSTYKDLRKESAEKIASMEQDGNAIGGVSVGEPIELMYEMTEIACSILPKDKPRYLMGVGTPENILDCIEMGIDMFDCVMPTRNGRNGTIFTRNGIMNMKNKKWANDFSPIDAESDLFADQQYSKAYLRHLYTAKEQLGGIIGSLHNLHFYLWLVKEARKHIIEGNFTTWKANILPKISQKL